MYAWLILSPIAASLCTALAVSMSILLVSAFASANLFSVSFNLVLFANSPKPLVAALNPPTAADIDELGFPTCDDTLFHPSAIFYPYYSGEVTAFAAVF